MWPRSVCHGEAQFYENDKFKNAKYRNALLFLTAKYSYTCTCANSVDPDQTAPDEAIYLLIGIACATLSCISYFSKYTLFVIVTVMLGFLIMFSIINNANHL